jgi:hypothetical protein
MRPGLDLYLCHHGVAGNTADQAGEPVARRVGHNHPVVPLVGGLGQLPGSLASAPPSTVSHPEPPAVISIRPASAQRRTVSSLTPSRLAASLIRNLGTLRLNADAAIPACQPGLGRYRNLIDFLEAATRPARPALMQVMVMALASWAAVSVRMTARWGTYWARTTAVSREVAGCLCSGACKGSSSGRQL